MAETRSCTAALMLSVGILCFSARRGAWEFVPWEGEFVLLLITCSDFDW